MRMGGKVVKNAAGFDLPKFFTGSLGRFGVLGEITFKVFPRPEATRTLRLAAGSLAAAVRLLMEAATSRHEFDALDVPRGGLDPYARQSGWIDLDLDALRIEPHAPFQVHDLLTGARHLWFGRRNLVQLEPASIPAHIFRLRRRVRSERDFEYFF